MRWRACPTVSESSQNVMHSILLSVLLMNWSTEYINHQLNRISIPSPTSERHPQGERQDREWGLNKYRYVTYVTTYRNHLSFLSFKIAKEKELQQDHTRSTYSARRPRHDLRWKCMECLDHWAKNGASLVSERPHSSHCTRNSSCFWPPAVLELCSNDLQMSSWGTSHHRRFRKTFKETRNSKHSLRHIKTTKALMQ